MERRSKWSYRRRARPMGGAEDRCNVSGRNHEQEGTYQSSRHRGRWEHCTMPLSERCRNRFCCVGRAFHRFAGLVRFSLHAVTWVRFGDSAAGATPVLAFRPADFAAFRPADSVCVTPAAHRCNARLGIPSISSVSIIEDWVAAFVYYPTILCLSHDEQFKWNSWVLCNHNWYEI